MLKPEPKVFDLQKAKTDKIPGKDLAKFLDNIDKAKDVTELRALVRALAIVVLGDRKK